DMSLHEVIQKTVKLILMGCVILMLLVATGHPMPAAAQTVTPFDFRDHPVHVIASYYNAITLQDYGRAYGYWDDTPPGGATYQQLTQGFANVQGVRVLARLPVTVDVAAGTAHAEVPVNVLVTQKTGNAQIFAGCFHVVQHNAPVGNPPTVDPSWYLHSASLGLVATVDFAQAADACSTVRSFPTGLGIDNQQTPLDLLSSYYDAIAARNYTRAYQYWPGGVPGKTQEQFAQGFATTDNVGVVVALPFRSGVAAGSAYTSMPLLITSTDSGQWQLYVGCITARKSNVPVGNTSTPDPNWYLSRADIRPAGTMEVGVQQVWSACSE
ncbi:hypothetical protein ACFLYO_06235, partial [Chloroflexota bacterium]